MIGGAISAASSYPSALVSSLAAHTFANLLEPTPDLVIQWIRHVVRIAAQTVHGGAGVEMAIAYCVDFVWTLTQRNLRMHHEWFFNTGLAGSMRCATP
jgi:hypothetical protein